VEIRQTGRAKLCPGLLGSCSESCGARLLQEVFWAGRGQGTAVFGIASLLRLLLHVRQSAGRGGLARPTGCSGRCDPQDEISRRSISGSLDFQSTSPSYICNRGFGGPAGYVRPIQSCGGAAAGGSTTRRSGWLASRSLVFHAVAGNI